MLLASIGAMKLPLFVVLIVAPTLSGLASPLSLHPLFSDHAVLQQELPVPVWGWAEPGAEVKIRFADQEMVAKTDDAGRWMTVLTPLRASAEPGQLQVSSGTEVLSVQDILVGEVWVGSGQSNMAMSVRSTLTADETLASVAKDGFKDVRMFRVPIAGEDERQETVKAAWQLPTAEAVTNFSAAAFYFAAKLAADRGVPVGIIQSANGGTNAYSWINRDTYEQDPIAEVVREHWKAMVIAYPKSRENYEKQKAAWVETVKAAKAKGEAAPGRAPREPLGPTHVKRPAGHYQAMIAPLQPYAIRGAIWYQGEANARAPFAEQYRDLMFALLEDWREDWAAASGGLVHRRDFPFYIVQLPNFGGGDPEGWSLIREQMLRFWQEGVNTGMVVAIDKGDAKDIHPKDKKPVGERLALFARAQAYGEKIVYSGPIASDWKVVESRAVVSFDHVGGGLKSFDGQALRHFELAGLDGAFGPAEARIEGETVVVSRAGVSKPTAVRYAWSGNPEQINFVNAEGFPSSPFRFPRP
jgi:sialate O-acetylesterase